MEKIWLLFGWAVCLSRLSAVELQQSPSKFTIPSKDAELVQVLMVYRHGERNPIMEYPKSKYANESDWVGGFGQLTLSGMKMHFEFGKWTMAHYGPNGLKFLPPVYDRRDYKVFSTNFDRTIQSALANSAGIYVPEVSQEIATDIQWNPVPIRTIMANEYDTVFGQFCPVMLETLEKLRRERFDNLKAQYQQLFKYIDEHSGLGVWDDPTLMHHLYDTLNVEKSLKREIPEWAEPIFQRPLQMFHEEFLNEFTENEKLTRLTAGPILKTIISIMLNSSIGEDEVKLYSFSAHDATVNSIMHALGVPLSMRPDYTAAVIFELYRDESKKHYVKVLYRPGAGTKDPEGQVIPGCGGTQYCTLETFIEVTRNVLPGDLRKECEVITDEFIQLSKDKESFRRE